MRADGVWRCGQGHAFDVAREGYVNLLLPQHRSSKNPGYSLEMIAGRRALFDAGHYQPLADDLAALIVGYLPTTPRPVVLDAGCGEGYYLRRLRARLVDGADAPLLVGLDLSRPGVRLAARRDPAGSYAVAGTFRMPVQDDRVDVLLTHFSPVSAADFRRVVPVGGTVLVGGPGPDHLYGFKQLLYDRPTRHQTAAELADEPGFELVATHHIRHPMTLRAPGEVANLLIMTPYNHSINAEARARLVDVAALDTEIDVVVHAYRRR